MGVHLVDARVGLLERRGQELLAVWLLVLERALLPIGAVDRLSCGRTGPPTLRAHLPANAHAEGQKDEHADDDELGPHVVALHGLQHFPARYPALIAASRVENGARQFLHWAFRQLPRWNTLDSVLPTNAAPGASRSLRARGAGLQVPHGRYPAEVAWAGVSNTAVQVLQSACRHEEVWKTFDFTLPWYAASAGPVVAPKANVTASRPMSPRSAARRSVPALMSTSDSGRPV